MKLDGERMESESLEDWLQRVLAEEVDVRPPKKNSELEKKYIERCAKVVLYGEKSPAAYCELRRCGGQLELCSVVVDAPKRGIGLSHELVRLALSRAAQDPIVSGQPLDRQEPPLVFAFTRSAALARTLTKAGFEIQPARRRWSRLFLFRSASANLSLRVQFALARERVVRTITMLTRDRKKAKGQIGNLGEYHLFTRTDGPPEQQEEPMTTDGIIALGMNVVRVTDDDLKPKTATTEETVAWDEGE